tara:strand:- start:303 stop:449 length:147 start_codon:yes stop_codon:yes gene_type:complete
MKNLEIAIYEIEKLAEDFGLWGYALTHDRLMGIVDNLKLLEKDLEKEV